MCVCVDFCLCLFRWVSGFLRFDGALCLCLFRWVSVFISMCVCAVMGLNRLIGVSWVCVWLYVLNRCQRLREKERKKKKLLESLGKQKFRLEKNDKERLKNNILIKIEF